MRMSAVLEAEVLSVFQFTDSQSDKNDESPGA